ncbi:MAG: L,D-transpeptidase family protein [Pseudomonadota bacterium]
MRNVIARSYGILTSAAMKVTAGVAATALLSFAPVQPGHAAPAGGDFVQEQSGLSLEGGFERLVDVFGPAPKAWTYDVASAEWRDKFDSSGGQGLYAVAEKSPTLGQHVMPALNQAIVRYQGIVQRGGWEKVATKQTLRLGVRNRAVGDLRERLTISGDLAERSGSSKVFDAYVEAAVRRFQRRHGIVPDGIVRENTLAALNIPATSRLAQLRINMNRLATMEQPDADRYVMVNIPAAEIEAVQLGFVRSRHTAVVGKIDRQTPILSSKVHQINFNPFWTVPKSIIRRDVIPTVQKDPTYLERYNIRILDGRGEEIDPLTVNWNTDEAVDYMFRQDPGEVNSLGSVKINFHNKHQVYLHDTPSKSLFASNFRFHSSGCIRVQNVRELVSWILSETDDWNRAKVDAVIRSGERVDVSVNNPVELHFVYVTAWAATDGTVNFRDDIYELDNIRTAGIVAQ